MDLTPHQEAKENEGPAGGADAAAAPSKPLEQEPLLAARIMIEDCMALLLDVEDIDRIFVAAGGGEPLWGPLWKEMLFVNGRL
jgi:hypothetical protein